MHLTIPVAGSDRGQRRGVCRGLHLEGSISATLVSLQFGHEVLSWTGHLEGACLTLP